MTGSSTVRRIASHPEGAPRAVARRTADPPNAGEATPGSPRHALLGLQRAAGNHSVEALLRGQDTSDRYRAPAAPLAVVQRSVISRASAPGIQRQPPDQQDPQVGPGYPQPPTPWMFNFGGKLDPNMAPSNLNYQFQIPGLGSTPQIPANPAQIPGQVKGLIPGSSGGGTPGGAVGPNACAPGMYNKLWQKCCPAGTQADDSGMNCVQAASLPKPPPPEPEQPGDFPTPDPNADTQVA